MKATTRLLAFLVAIAVCGSASASSAPPPPKIQKVMTCLGLVGIVHDASEMVLKWSGPTPPKTAVDTATRALLKATHGEGALIDSVVHTVSRLPNKVIDAAARFCASKAGRDYAKMMSGGVDNTVWSKVSKDKTLIALAKRLATVTQVANAGRDEAFLALRNAAGARGMVMHAQDNPKEGKQGREDFADVYKFTVAEALMQKLHGKGPDTHEAVLRATAIGFAKTPRSELKAMLRFFGSHVGKAIEKSLVDGINAAMDDAWQRMAKRFLAGKVLPKTGGR